MASPYRNVIITGANRGIGLEFVRQFLQLATPPVSLIAATRSPSESLQSLQSAHANLHLVKYDATDFENYDHFIRQVDNIVGEQGVDLLINNAGIYLRDTLATVEAANVLKNIETNSVAPLMLTKALLSLLKASAQLSRRTVVVNISSQMGSIEQNQSGGAYAYRASKTALNMLMQSFQVDVKSVGIIILNLHPGHVKTDMGTESAPITAVTSVTGLMDIIHRADQSHAGMFRNYAGVQLPW